MPINRAPFDLLIDDSGNNADGTPWNKAQIASVLLDPIDTAIVPTYGSFTPTDRSGAGLVFGSPSGAWAKYGRLAFVWLQVVYPSTGSAAGAVIGGLPFPIKCVVGGWQGYGVGQVWYLIINDNATYPLNPATGLQRSNAEMSGQNQVIASVYLTD